MPPGRWSLSPDALDFSGLGQFLTLPSRLARMPYKSESFFTPALLSSTASSTASTTISSPGFRANASATFFGIVALRLFPIFCNFTLVAIYQYTRHWIHLKIPQARLCSVARNAPLHGRLSSKNAYRPSSYRNTDCQEL